MKTEKFLIENIVGTECEVVGGTLGEKNRCYCEVNNFCRSKHFKTMSTTDKQSSIQHWSIRY